MRDTLNLEENQEAETEQTESRGRLGLSLPVLFLCLSHLR